MTAETVVSQFTPSGNIRDLYAPFKSARKPCSDIGSDTLEEFYSKDETVQQRVIAKFCNRCPLLLRERCLEIARVTDQPGIWGGTTEDQRKKMKKNERLRQTRALKKQTP